MADIVSTGRANPGLPDGAKTTILAIGNRCSHVEFPVHDLANAEYRAFDSDRTDPPLFRLLNFTRYIPLHFLAASSGRQWERGKTA